VTFLERNNKGTIAYEVADAIDFLLLIQRRIWSIHLPD
jgi:hypothetical protein